MNNIYRDIFKEIYGFDLNHIDGVKAKPIKESIVRLRTSYLNDMPVTDYDNSGIRKAYMLTYYPNYVLLAYELIKNVMNTIIVEFQGSRKKRLKLVYFAAGPGPEVYGSLKALDELNFNKRIEPYILDFEEQWENERQVTCNLVKNTLNLRISTFNYISGCDLRIDCENGKCSSCTSCEETVFLGDIFFMENCINHMSKEVNFSEKLKRKIQKMKSGAFFVIIDLDYSNVKEVFESIIKNGTDIVEVYSTNIYSGISKSRLNIDMPSKMEEYIFDRSPRLMAKKNTNYYYLILKRK